MRPSLLVKVVDGPDVSDIFALGILGRKERGLATGEGVVREGKEKEGKLSLGLDGRTKRRATPPHD